MYLSDRDLEWAIKKGRLIVGKRPIGQNDVETSGLAIDPTSIDLHLDSVDEAQIWDIEKYAKECKKRGVTDPELNIGTFNYGDFSGDYLRSPPNEDPKKDYKVFKRGNNVVIRPYGFLLWQTKEIIGTPKRHPNFICFIDGKSTRARTGILVHLTAPTIHAGWSGNVVLEIANLGPFSFVLQEDDVIAQLTVSTISCPPVRSMKEAGSVTFNQRNVRAGPARKSRPK